jgi:hypothetical protein
LFFHHDIIVTRLFPDVHCKFKIWFLLLAAHHQHMRQQRLDSRT